MIKVVLFDAEYPLVWNLGTQRRLVERFGSLDKLDECLTDAAGGFDNLLNVLDEMIRAGGSDPADVIGKLRDEVDDLSFGDLIEISSAIAEAIAESRTRHIFTSPRRGKSEKKQQAGG